MGLGQRIRQIRGKMSQSDFGKSLGISQYSVGVYESESRFPDSRILNKICNAFAISPEWLLIGEGPMHRGDPSDETKEQKMSDSRTFENTIKTQYIENNNEKNIPPQLNVRQSDIWGYMEKTIQLQDRLLAAAEQITDLRIQLERRDMRIRELERELDALKEARKGIARAQDQIGQLAG